MKKNKLGQSFGEKKWLLMLNITSESCTGREKALSKEINTAKERPPVCHWNNEKAALRTRLQPVQFLI